MPAIFVRGDGWGARILHPRFLIEFTQRKTVDCDPVGQRQLGAVMQFLVAPAILLGVGCFSITLAVVAGTCCRKPRSIAINNTSG